MKIKVRAPGTEPLLVVGGRVPASTSSQGLKKRPEIVSVSTSSPGLAKRQAELVAAVRLDELALKVDTWLKSGANINKTHFLRQLRTMASLLGLIPSLIEADVTRV